MPSLEWGYRWLQLILTIVLYVLPIDATHKLIGIGRELGQRYFDFLREYDIRMCCGIPKDFLLACKAKKKLPTCSTSNWSSDAVMVV